MSQRIVDGLEFIKIEEHQADFSVVALGNQQGMFQTVREQSTVGPVWSVNRSEPKIQCGAPLPYAW